MTHYHYDVIMVIVSNCLHLNLILWNHWANWNPTWYECSLDGPLLFFIVIGNISLPFKYTKFPNFGPFKIPFPNKYAKKIKTHKDEHLKKYFIKIGCKINKFQFWNSPILKVPKSANFQNLNVFIFHPVLMQIFFAKCPPFEFLMGH
jgi:hypothetical protein